MVAGMRDASECNGKVRSGALERSGTSWHDAGWSGGLFTTGKAAGQR